MSVTRSIRGRAGRVVAVTAATGAVAAILVGGTLAANAAVTPNDQAQVQAPAAAVDQAVTAQTVPTGLRGPAGEFVLSVREFVPAEPPETRFGVMLGVRDASGAVTDLIMANEVEGSDVAPGFHAFQAPTTVDDIAAPSFGYYAGPAAKITGKAPSGATIEAGLAEITLFGTPVVLFWFDPALTGECVEGDSAGPKTGPAACDVTEPAAFDASGAALPAGPRSVPGHG